MLRCAVTRSALHFPESEPPGRGDRTQGIEGATFSLTGRIPGRHANRAMAEQRLAAARLIAEHLRATHATKS